VVMPILHAVLRQTRCEAWAGSLTCAAGTSAAGNACVWSSGQCLRVLTAGSPDSACGLLQDAFADCSLALAMTPTLDPGYTEAIATRGNIKRLYGSYEVRHSAPVPFHSLLNYTSACTWASACEFDAAPCCRVLRTYAA